MLAACSSDKAATPATSETAPTSATQVSAAPEPTVADTEPVATEAPATTPVADSTTPEPAPLTMLGAGPYKVGVQTITVADPTGTRPLTVDVWFPLRDGVEGALHEYTLVPGNFYRSPAAIDALPTDIASDGPFPLVVYSHGSGGLRYVASYTTEALASYGYVVAAPDHTGNTAVDRLTGGGTEFDVTAFNRPNDIEVVINAMLDPANPTAGVFATSVDAQRIAVTGHSFGGFTALAMASGYTNSIGTFSADPRVDAVIAMAPATGDGQGRLLSDDDLAAIKIPTLLIVGQDDKTTPVEPNITRPWELANAEPFYRVELVAGEHQSFTDICDYQVFLPTLPDVLPQITETIETMAAEGCAATDMPIARVKELTNTLSVQFLESIFRNGAPIDPSTTLIPDDMVLLTK